MLEFAPAAPARAQGQGAPAGDGERRHRRSSPRTAGSRVTMRRGPGRHAEPPFVFNPLTHPLVRGRNVESLRRLQALAESRASRASAAMSADTGRVTRRGLLGAGAAAGAAAALPARRGRGAAPARGRGGRGRRACRPGVARVLVAAGRSVIAPEARDRVGGRTLNRSVGGGEVVEAGGQWIGPTQDRLAALAARAARADLSDAHGGPGGLPPARATASSTRPSSPVPPDPRRR